MPYTVNDSILALRMAGLAAFAARLCEVDNLAGYAEEHARATAADLRAATLELHAANEALVWPGASPAERAAAAFAVTKARAICRRYTHSLARVERERTQLAAERRALAAIVDTYDPGSNEPLSDFLAAQFLAAAA